MLCFKDKTFCHWSYAASDNPEHCGHYSCGRYLSRSDVAHAEDLELPIAIADLRTNQCGYVPVARKEEA